MSQNDTNKQIVKHFWAAFSTSRFDEALALLSEDATWWVAGTTSISGTYTKAQFADLVAGVANGTEGGIQVTPTQLTAQQRDLFEQLAETFGSETKPQTGGRGIFDKMMDFLAGDE